MTVDAKQQWRARVEVEDEEESSASAGSRGFSAVHIHLNTHTYSYIIIIMLRRRCGRRKKRTKTKNNNEKINNNKTGLCRAAIWRYDWTLSVGFGVGSSNILNVLSALTKTVQRCQTHVSALMVSLQTSDFVQI